MCVKEKSTFVRREIENLYKYIVGGKKCGKKTQSDLR